MRDDVRYWVALSTPKYAGEAHPPGVSMSRDSARTDYGASRGLPPRDLTLMPTFGTPFLLRCADEAEAPLANGAYSVSLPQSMK